MRAACKESTMTVSNIISICRVTLDDTVPALENGDRLTRAEFERVWLWYDGDRPCVLVAELIQQSSGCLEIGRIEALGEPAVDRAEKLPSGTAFPPTLPEPAQAHRRPQFQ